MFYDALKVIYVHYKKRSAKDTLRRDIPDDFF